MILADGPNTIPELRRGFEVVMQRDAVLRAGPTYISVGALEDLANQRIQPLVHDLVQRGLLSRHFIEKLLEREQAHDGKFGRIHRLLRVPNVQIIEQLQDCIHRLFRLAERRHLLDHFLEPKREPVAGVAVLPRPDHDAEGLRVVRREEVAMVLKHHADGLQYLALVAGCLALGTNHGRFEVF